MKTIRLSLMVEVATMVVVMFAIFPKAAHAYIDPGSGSMIWQVLIAAGLAIGYLVRQFMRRMPGRDKSQEPDEKAEGGSQDG